MAPILFQQGPSAHDYLFLYNGVTLGHYAVQAIRHAQFKAHYYTKRGCVDAPAEPHNPPLLFNVETDPSEQYVHIIRSVLSKIFRFPIDASQHPKLVEQFDAALAAHKRSVIPGVDQLSRGQNKTLAICCNHSTQCVCGQ